ncbi:putative transmembrane protein [Lachnospiraceae bacterium TWA4]|nr:putative transmembrane protein [Lachnospiraceae bacterium TWA4]
MLKKIKPLDAKAYAVNQDSVIAVYDKLSKQQLNVTSYTDTTIDGTMNVAEDGLLMFSIPYDPGWTLTVDGKDVPLNPFKESLLSANLTKGNHDIHLEYHTQGLQTGTLISLCAIIGLLFILFLKNY